MKELSLKLENADGLHARPAAVFAKAASQYQSKIEITAKGMTKNAKSIMGLLSLSLEKGDDIKIVASGADEEAAGVALKALIENQFAEHE